MSAHHFFRDFAYCDSGMLPWLLVARLISRTGRSLRDMVRERMTAYPCSGEINRSVRDAAAVMTAIRAEFAPQALSEEHVDGLSLTFADWRFNLRPSNTEPLLRLNVESRGDAALMQRMTDTLLQRIGTELSLCQQQKQPDTQTLTAGFLTEQIDSAFTLWQPNWTRQYSFDTFCRYVLPYRVGHERTGNWRRTFVTPVGIRAEYRTAAPDTTYAYGIANNILGSMRSEIYYPPQFLPDLPLEALAHVKSASCKEYAHLCVTLLRAHGLAATVDFTPQWGNQSMGHEWCVFFPDDHTAIPFNPGERLGDHFMKRKEDRLPKVFRTTYEKRPESLCMQNQGREAIPEVFDTPCLIDVTWEYTQTADIEVPLYGGLPHSRYAYLAVFDNQDWSIVHWGERKGGRASFADMACGIVYLPVLYSDEYGVQPAGDAFLLDTAGTVRPLVAETARRPTGRVKRKFRDTRSNQFLQAVVGGKSKWPTRKTSATR